MKENFLPPSSQAWNKNFFSNFCGNTKFRLYLRNCAKIVKFTLHFRDNSSRPEQREKSATFLFLAGTRPKIFSAANIFIRPVSVFRAELSAGQDHGYQKMTSLFVLFLCLKSWPEWEGVPVLLVRGGGGEGARGPRSRGLNTGRHHTTKLKKQIVWYRSYFPKV